MLGYGSDASEGEAMEPATAPVDPITDDWCAHRFDHLSPELALALHETLAKMRDDHPVARSEAYGGFWVVTRYEDVLKVAQDWQTFSSAQGVSVPDTKMVVKAIPEHLDPPLHRVYKRLINAHFTPAVVAGYEQPTRDLVTRLIDDFIEDGRCDFMAGLARPFPGLAFFELVLNAPSDEVLEINEMATTASVATHPKAKESWQAMFRWITELVAQRRRQPPKGDVVDAVLNAEIEGRPITDDEIIGVIQLLILGGLDTTAGALGQFMIRFTREPEIPELLRRDPEVVTHAVEELLRLEPPFIAIARTATRDTEIGGQAIARGDKVLIYWASANRDEAEFACPAQFDLDRPTNRHLAFGAGPHRCAGSNLARLNLRVAVEEVVRRLHDVKLQDGAEPIPFHSALNRAPHRVPITFSPGPRELAVTA
jgi:cytochrome P450